MACKYSTDDYILHISFLTSQTTNSNIVFLHAPIESNNCPKRRVLSAKTLVKGDTCLVKRVL